LNINNKGWKDNLMKTIPKKTKYKGEVKRRTPSVANESVVPLWVGSLIRWIPVGVRNHQKGGTGGGANKITVFDSGIPSP